MVGEVDRYAFAHWVFWNMYVTFMIPYFLRRIANLFSFLRAFANCVSGAVRVYRVNAGVPYRVVNLVFFNRLRYVNVCLRYFVVLPVFCVDATRVRICLHLFFYHTIFNRPLLYPLPLMSERWSNNYFIHCFAT